MALGLDSVITEHAASARTSQEAADLLGCTVGQIAKSLVFRAASGAPVLVIASYFMGPAPMSLEFWPGAVVMMLFAALSATFIAGGGRAAWFSGVLMLGVYLVFAMTLYLLPPAGTAG